MITPVNYNFISYKPSFRANPSETGNDSYTATKPMEETIVFELNPLKKIIANVDPGLKDFTYELIELLTQENKTPQEIMHDKRKASDLILERAQEYYKEAIPISSCDEEGIKYLDDIAFYKDGRKFSGVLLGIGAFGRTKMAVYKDGKRKEIFWGTKELPSGKLHWEPNSIAYSAYNAYDKTKQQKKSTQIPHR
jgi:hypothetical protein